MDSMRLIGALCALLLPLPTLSGCTGMVHEPGAQNDPGEPQANARSAISASPLRRLTSTEYRNTAQDLLGQGDELTAIWSELASIPDGDAHGFASGNIAADLEVIRQYQSVAEKLAEAAVSTQRSFLVSCDLGTPECVEQFITQFGRRAFRRPLSSADVERYVALYRAVSEADGLDLALETVIAGFLFSPNFLYHKEFMTNASQNSNGVDGAIALDPYAFASRLSYLLWSSMPDDELLDAAGAGDLDDDTGVAAQVERMVDDPRFARTINNFHEQWLELSLLESTERTDPEWNDSLKQAMRQETMQFVDYVWRQGDARIETLLGASFSFVNGPLAELYGIDPPSKDFDRVDLNPDERSGLLTHASVLTQFGTVFPEVHRGLFIRDRILCDRPPPPPPDLELDGTVSRLETQPCSGCHVSMDPIGQGFAGYDSMGRKENPDSADDRPAFQVHDNSRSLDPSLVGTFSSLREFARRLATSEHVARCMSTEWFRFAMGRGESERDAWVLDQLGTDLAEADGDLRHLLLRIAMSPWFRARAEATP